MSHARAPAAAPPRPALPRLLATPRRAALAWAGATFLVLALLAGGPGISGDEGAVLERAASARGAAPGAAAPGLAAPLAPYAAAAGRAALTPLGASSLRAARLGTALLGALLSAALVVLCWGASGPGAALLAPALFWAAPRHLHAGLVATPDLALAALAAATAVAWRRSRVDPVPRRRALAAAAAGVLFGAALAARIDGWVLVAALAVEAAASRALRAREAVPADAGAVGGAGIERRPGGVPPALVAMATIGPLLLAALWPGILADAPRAFARGEAVPLLRSARTAALTLPATVLLASLAGIGLALLRVVRAVRRRAPAAPAADGVLLLACAAAPFLAGATGIAPAAPGVRPWLHAMPFLAALGAQAIVAAARVAWPARAVPLIASLALLVLWPGLRAAAHSYPNGSSAWNEIAGGAPGAATLALERQDGGEAAAALLGEINARARQGARVYWATTSPAAVRAYARDGRLRADLAVADRPEDADVAVVTIDGGSRDAEYRAWGAFRTARPSAGAYLDEVPLALVYARPGAWR